MEFSIIQVALVFVVTFIAAIDQFDFLESLYQPMVTSAVIGLSLASSAPSSRGWYLSAHDDRQHADRRRSAA